MVYYNRIDLSEGIGVAKKNNSNEWMVGHYLFFWSWVQSFVFSCCHALMIFCLNLSDIAIITAKNVDYHCIIYDIGKSERVYLLENSVLDDREYI